MALTRRHSFQVASVRIRPPPPPMGAAYLHHRA
jgi:hypothetical protein